jgi:aerobic carbon-monoxide dehydrogenase small subunit
MTGPVEITLTVNGRDYRLRVEPRRTLLDAIRDDCGLTGNAYGLRARRLRRVHHLARL